MLRPLFVTGSLVHGGAERHSVTVMNQLAARGHDCHGVYIKNDRSQLDRVQLGPEGSMYCLNARRYLDGSALSALTEHLQRLQPSIIVAANSYALTYASLARRRARLRVPLVVTFHTTNLPSFKERVKLTFERLFFATADCLVFVCDNQRRYWQRRGLLARRYAVVHNGIDVDHFRAGPFLDEAAGLRRAYGFAENDFVIGMAAVLRPEKNPVFLVDALAALRRAGIPARLLVIGDGPMRPAVEARARELGVDGAMRITGLQQDVRPLMAVCDVIALCSTAVETFSLAALEAMAMGKPVIHSDLGGASEMIRPGHNGFIFPVGDLTSFLHSLALVAERGVARQLGANARQVVEERFSQTGMVDRYEQLLIELCSAGAKARPPSPPSPGAYGYVVIKQDYTRSKDL